MERRELIKSIMACSALPILGHVPVFAKTFEDKPDPLKLAKLSFNKSLENSPELIGFKGTTSNYSKSFLSIEGSIPTDLKGCFYRNGAARHERGEQRYQHLFEGDGMVHAFHIQDGKIFHQGKFVETPKFVNEQKKGKFLYSGPDSKLRNGLPVSSADTINTANTNVIHVKDELWALWEAGSPVALDPTDLSTKRIVNLGDNSHYQDKLKGLAFSAHPKIDPSGDIWNFGMSPTGQAVLYHLGSNGKMKNVGIVNANYDGGMLHDFLITHKHILLILPPLTVNPNKDGFFSAISFNQESPMRVLVISKQNLTLLKEYELDAGFAFHYGNAWEDTDGTIRFDASLYPNIDVMHHMTGLMSGNISTQISPSQTVFFQLNPNGSTHKTVIDGISEFPRIHDNKVGLKNNYLYSLASIKTDLWSDAVSALNTETGSKDTYIYGSDYLVEEHIVVGERENELDGYLIGTALHIPSKRTCLNIFKLGDIAKGPVCRAWLDYHIPLGFHGNFVNS